MLRGGSGFGACFGGGPCKCVDHGCRLSPHGHVTPRKRPHRRRSNDPPEQKLDGVSSHSVFVPVVIAPPALRLSAAIRAGGHDTTLKKPISGASGFNHSQQHPFPLSCQVSFGCFGFAPRSLAKSGPIHAHQRAICSAGRIG